jgi:hypothetical protein
MNVRYREEKNKFHLSERQKIILVGTLLGDGNLTRHGKDFRLFVKHSKSQSILGEWKIKEFGKITKMKLNFFQQEVKGKIYGFCQFATLTHPEFNKYRKIFYSKSKKVIPKKIDEILMKPLSLAVWIMDDGARDNVGMSIQTHNFSPKGIRRLQRCLWKNFGILATIRKNKNKEIIYLPQSQIKKLHRLVKNYLLPEYKYKFPLAP